MPIVLVKMSLFSGVTEAIIYSQFMAWHIICDIIGIDFSKRITFQSGKEALIIRVPRKGPCSVLQKRFQKSVKKGFPMQPGVRSYVWNVEHTFRKSITQIHQLIQQHYFSIICNQMKRFATIFRATDPSENSCLVNKIDIYMCVSEDISQNSCQHKSTCYLSFLLEIILKILHFNFCDWLPFNQSTYNRSKSASTFPCSLQPELFLRVGHAHPLNKQIQRSTL